MDLNIDILNRLARQSSNAATLHREIVQILKGLPDSSSDSLIELHGCQVENTSKKEPKASPSHEHSEMTNLGSSPREDSNSDFRQDIEIRVTRKTIAPSDPPEVSLKSDELAFYRALTFDFGPDSRLEVKRMARELAKTIRENATLDWDVSEAGRAKLRILAKRLLRKYCYPNEKCEKTASRVLDCAAALAAKQGYLS